VSIGAVVAIVALAAGLAALAALSLRRGSEASGTRRLEARLEVQAAELRRLSDAAAARDVSGEHLRDELSAARHALEEMNVRERERVARRREEAEVIRRLSTVLAGGAAKGRSGENVLREHLAALPHAMLVRDFRVNGRVVEFALRLPDGRCLPVDSKWPAVAELEALGAAADPVDRAARARAVERAVAARAREVAAYLDPASTAPVALAAIPDAAYEVLRRAHADAFVRGVVIVPYSSALPVTLFLYSLVQRFGDTGDVRACLADIGSLLAAMDAVLENKIARGGIMIANGSDELRSQLGRARGSLGRAVGSADAVPDDAEPTDRLRVIP
jgi:DNA recombination protein RmuC